MGLLVKAIERMDRDLPNCERGLHCKGADLRVANALETLGLVVIYPDQGGRGGWLDVGDDIIDKVRSGQITAS